MLDIGILAVSSDTVIGLFFAWLGFSFLMGAVSVYFLLKKLKGKSFLKGLSWALAIMFIPVAIGVAGIGVMFVYFVE